MKEQPRNDTKKYEKSGGRLSFFVVTVSLMVVYMKVPSEMADSAPVKGYRPKVPKARQKAGNAPYASVILLFLVVLFS